MIRLAESFLTDPKTDQRHTLTHELLHCHLGPMTRLLEARKQCCRPSSSQWNTASTAWPTRLHRSYLNRRRAQDRKLNRAASDWTDQSDLTDRSDRTRHNAKRTITWQYNTESSAAPTNRSPGGDDRNNGFLPLSGGASTVHPANMRDRAGDRRNGSFPLSAGGAGNQRRRITGSKSAWA